MRKDPSGNRGALADVQTISVPNVRVSIVQVSPYQRFESHSHTLPHICFVLEGGFEEFNGDGTDACGVTWLRYSPGNDSHRVVFGPSGARCMLVEINAPNLPEIDRRTFQHGERLTCCAQALVSEFQRRDPARVLRVEELALELWAAGLRGARRRSSSAPPSWLERARARLDELAANPTDMRNRLSTTAGVHPTHLTRAFREHFGMTPVSYRARRRVERALELIGSNRWTLARIAAECGFSDQSHMTRCFVRVLQNSPARVRQQIRKNHLLPC